MIVGCYDLNLYCDAPKCTNGQYGLYPSQLEANAETGAECRREARRLGWWLSQKHGTCACPPCARAGHRPTASPSEHEVSKLLANRGD